MLNAVSVSDYSVKIGDGSCNLLADSLTDSSLECVPPMDQPPGADADGKHRVVVLIITISIKRNLPTFNSLNTSNV